MSGETTDRLSEKLSENWDAISVPGRLEAGCPAPFRIESSFYYDGGTISLLIDKTEILSIEREAEFSRMTVSVRDAAKKQSDRVIEIMSKLCDRAILRADQEAKMSKAARAEKAMTALDDLPENLEEPKTVWAIAKIGQIGNGFIAGPFDDAETAMAHVGENIAVEIGDRGGAPLRGFTADERGIVWHDSEACVRLKPRPEDGPEP